MFYELIVILCISFLTCICTTFVSFDFMRKLKRNIYRTKWVYGIMILIHVLLVTSVSIFNYPIQKTVMMCILNVLMGHFLFNKEKMYMIYYGLFSLCIGICEFIVVPIFNVVFMWSDTFYYKNAWYSSLMLVTAQVIVLCSYRLFLEFFRKKEIKRLNKVQVFNFIFLPLFSFLNIMIMLTLTQYIMYPILTALIVINIIFILFLNVYLTYLFHTISQNNDLKNEIALYEQKADLQYEYYNNLEKKYESSRKIIHDMKNHLQSMERLYDMEEHYKGKKYSDDIMELLNSFNQDYYTTNSVLNIVINDKVEIGNTYGIDMSCKLNDVSLDFMREIDVTTIFANLLDNAIAAAKDVKQNPYIVLKANKVQEFIVISIINSCNDKTLDGSEKLMSSKKKHEGLGLGNVKMALEKYDGHMRIEREEDEFKVNLFIPIEE